MAPANTSFKIIPGEPSETAKYGHFSKPGTIQGLDILIAMLSRVGATDHVIVSWFPNDDLNRSKEEIENLAHAICTAALMFPRHLILFGGTAAACGAGV